MLYSSCRNPVLQIAEQEIGVPIAKRLEVSDPAEITEAYIHEELHPPAAVAREAFARPKKPGKGGRRLLRAEAAPNSDAAAEEQD